jgi:CRISPR-associated protein Csx17
MKGASTDLSDSYLLRLLRNRLQSASGLKWLDAVGMSVSRSLDSDVPRWFPLLASGGGEASGQYVVNHQQRLVTALLADDKSQSRRQLASCLFADNQTGALEANAMGAMYYPSLMKAPNVGQDFLPNPQRRVNPWDFILLLEGSLVWSMAATRRQGVTSERGSFRSIAGRLLAVR